MALTVIKQPEALNYSGNPVGFVFQSTNTAENVLWVQIAGSTGGTILATIRKQSTTAEIQIQDFLASTLNNAVPYANQNTSGFIIVEAEFTEGPPPPLYNNFFLVRGIRGAYSKIEYAKGKRALQFSKFLTSQTKRPTTPTAKTFLVIGTDSTPFDTFFTVQVNYKDGTTYNHIPQFTLPTVPAWESSTFDISWDIYNYGNLDPAGAGKEIKNIELLFPLGGGLLLELRPVAPAKWRREFHWENQLGGLDSAVFTGAFKESKEVERVQAERFLPLDYTLQTPQFFDYTTTSKPIFEGNSGYMTKEEARAAAGLLDSKNAWEKVGNDYIPINIVSSESLLFDDESGLYSFEFSYKHAFDL